MIVIARSVIRSADGLEKGATLSAVPAELPAQPLPSCSCHGSTALPPDDDKDGCHRSHRCEESASKSPSVAVESLPSARCPLMAAQLCIICLQAVLEQFGHGRKIRGLMLCPREHWETTALGW